MLKQTYFIFFAAGRQVRRLPAGIRSAAPTDLGERTLAGPPESYCGTTLTVTYATRPCNGRPLRDRTPRKGTR